MKLMKSFLTVPILSCYLFSTFHFYIIVKFQSHSVSGLSLFAVKSFAIYFFKGDLYWKYDPDSNPSVDNSYPRPISKWKGIPNNIDAAITYSNSKAYFFKSGKYYKFDDDTLAVSQNDVYPYPRDVGEWWFGC